MSRKTDPFAIDLTPELIVRAYQAGIFPMAEDADSPDLFWVSPQKRGIIPLDAFHISRTLRKTLRTHSYAVKVDTDFAGVIEGCATAGVDRDTTWINPEIRRLYGALFDRGMVHTVEVWDGADLVGGLLRRVARRRLLRRIDVPPQDRTAPRSPWRTCCTASSPAATACSTPSSSPIT